MARGHMRCIPGAALIAAFAVLLSSCSAANSPSSSPPVAVAQSASRAGKTAAFFLSNLGTSVTAYATASNPNAPQPLEALTQDLTRSDGIWVDAKGTTYVTNACCAAGPPVVSVVEFARRATTPSLRITDGLQNPGAVTVGSDGTVYVSDVEDTSQDILQGVVLVYKRGQTSPKRSIPLPDPAYGLEPGGIVLDPQGNVLVATLNPQINAIHIFRIPHDTSKASDTGIQNAAGDSIGVDAAGNIYTANLASTNGTVAVYAAGTTQPTRTYSLGPQIASIAVASDGTLYATTGDNKGVLQVAPGGSTIAQTFRIAGAGIALGQF